MIIRLPKPDGWKTRVLNNGGDFHDHNGTPRDDCKTNTILREMSEEKIDLPKLSDILLSKTSPEKVVISVEIEAEDFIFKDPNAAKYHKRPNFPWARIMNIYSYIHNGVGGKTKYYWHQPDKREFEVIDGFFVYEIILSKKDKFKKKEEIGDIVFANIVLIKFNPNIFADGPLHKPGVNISIRGSGYILEDLDATYYQKLELDIEKRQIINRTKGLNEIIEITNIDNVVDMVSEAISKLAD